MVGVVDSMIQSVHGRAVTLQGKHVNDLEIVAIDIGSVEGSEDEDGRGGQRRMRSRLLTVEIADLESVGSYNAAVIDEETWSIPPYAHRQDVNTVTWRIVSSASVNKMG